jgi:hypothetical protein
MAITHQVAERPSIEAVLRKLLTVEDCGAVNKSLTEKLQSLKKKLSSNQLHLAVLGQMKREKSSFTNALPGTEILPTGVLPGTDVITEIKYGPAPCATILRTTGQREEIVLSTPGGLHYGGRQPRQQDAGRVC